MTLPFVINYAVWGEVTSFRVQSVGEDSAGLQLVDKLATNRVFFWTLDRGRFFSADELWRSVASQRCTFNNILEIRKCHRDFISIIIYKKQNHRIVIVLTVYLIYLR